jgi:4-diphosphocytidyl-2-C-methyl-D-erythritol kinase
MVGKEQITTLSDGLRVLAPAKINLSLLIAGKRPDGFHEIETTMAKVDLFDEILIQPGEKPGIELLCKGPYWAPQGKENLAYKACEMLMENSCPQTNLKITLTKNIPAGSGLGSASSDAAATLIALNKYLDLKLSNRRLAKLAPKLGSDVAFFLGGPLAFCTGKGEKIKKLKENFNFSALLILPDVSVSTEKVYANYKHNPALYKKLNAQINSHLAKNRIDLVSRMCANMLETSCFSLYKELFDLKAKVELLACAPMCLSGSGSVMFCIIEDADQKKTRENKHKLLEKTGCKSVIVSNNRW